MRRRKRRLTEMSLACLRGTKRARFYRVARFPPRRGGDSSGNRVSGMRPRADASTEVGCLHYWRFTEIKRVRLSLTQIPYAADLRWHRHVR